MMRSTGFSQGPRTQSQPLHQRSGRSGRAPPALPCEGLPRLHALAPNRAPTSHRTSSWPGLQLRDIAAALIPSWIETHEGSRTIDARGEAGPYGPYDVLYPPLFVYSLTVRGLGVPSLKACMSKPLPDWRRAPRGKSPRKPKSIQRSTRRSSTKARTPSRPSARRS